MAKRVANVAGFRFVWNTSTKACYSAGYVDCAVLSSLARKLLVVVVVGYTLLCLTAHNKSNCSKRGNDEEGAGRVGRLDQHGCVQFLMPALKSICIHIENIETLMSMNRNRPACFAWRVWPP